MRVILGKSNSSGSDLKRLVSVRLTEEYMCLLLQKQLNSGHKVFKEMLGYGRLRV